MEKKYTKINWDEPKTRTSFGDTNVNYLDISIDEIIINIKEGDENGQSIQSHNMAKST